MLNAKTAISCLTIALLTTIPLTARAAVPCKKYDHAAARQLVAFVKAAADLVKIKGEKAFPQFRKKGGKWFKGERYIFVDTLGGVCMVNPALPSQEGKNLWHVKDVNGNRIVAHFIREVTYRHKSQGWSHYLWPRPGAKKPVWKSAYVIRVKAPSGREYIVGSGVYNMPMEKCFAIDLVKEAVELLKRIGQRAFSIIGARNQGFYYKHAYVWVVNQKGVLLVNAGFPRLVGKSLWNRKDKAGVYVVREYIALAKKLGRGWTTYRWPKPPGRKKWSTKHNYVEAVKVGGELLVVGCGVYLD